jgi:hypothetical protein
LAAVEPGEDPETAGRSAGEEHHDHDGDSGQQGNEPDPELGAHLFFGVTDAGREGEQAECCHQGADVGQQPAEGGHEPAFESLDRGGDGD